MSRAKLHFLSEVYVSGVSINGVSLVTIELFFKLRSCVFTWLVRHSNRPLENALRSLVSRRLPDIKSNRILNSCLNFSCAHNTICAGKIVLGNSARSLKPISISAIAGHVYGVPLWWSKVTKKWPKGLSSDKKLFTQLPANENLEKLIDIVPKKKEFTKVILL